MADYLTKAASRGTEFVACYCGEELVVVLPNTGVSVAEVVVCLQANACRAWPPPDLTIRESSPTLDEARVLDRQRKQKNVGTGLTLVKSVWRQPVGVSILASTDRDSDAVQRI